MCFDCHCENEHLCSIKGYLAPDVCCSFCIYATKDGKCTNEAVISSKEPLQEPERIFLALLAFLIWPAAWQDDSLFLYIVAVLVTLLAASLAFVVIGVMTGEIS